MEDLLTERAISWLSGLATMARVAMLLFIFFALTSHVRWEDAAAIVFAFYLVARALLRMRSDR